MWWDYTKAVILIVLIIGAAYYVTKYIAQKGTGMSVKGSEIKLLGSRSFGRDKHIIITEVGEKVYVLGMTNQSFTLLDTIPAQEFPVEETAAAPAAPSAFAKEFLERLKGKQ